MKNFWYPEFLNFRNSMMEFQVVFYALKIWFFFFEIFANNQEAIFFVEALRRQFDF
jgi:hypothetical protein